MNGQREYSTNLLSEVRFPARHHNVMQGAPGFGRKPIVLVINRFYLPAFKAGGPVRTLANMIAELQHIVDFKVITSDRDSFDTDSFPAKNLDCWDRHNGTPVYYLSPHRHYYITLSRLLNDVTYDAVYLNSFFCPRFTIPVLALRRARLVPRKPTVLAPRGELSPGALGLKSAKKRAYVRLAKMVGLYDGVRWQASSEYELRDIRREMGIDCAVSVAPNLTNNEISTPTDSTRIEKRPGELRAVFLSRVDPMKNLKGALAMLTTLAGRVEFDIFGPIQDTTYWCECERLIRKLPNDVTVIYRGPIQHQRVGETLAQYHLLLLPTLGENFGHVIHEALSAGCPVLISDRTPWRDLEREGVGWDVPLDQLERFTAVLQRCVFMSADEQQVLSTNARAFARKREQDTDLLSRHLALFDLHSAASN